MGRPRKSVNIRKIAEAAAVSIATVSRVLNNKSDVSEEVRERVKAAMDRLAFVPSPVNAKTRNIGIVMPLLHAIIGPYLSEVMGGMADYALSNETELTMVFLNLNGKSSLVDSLRARGCHSAIVFMSHMIEGQVKELSDSGTPSILINGRSSLPDVGFIDCDSFEGGFLMGKHLASLGHKRIAFLRNLPAQDHIAREEGLMKALKESGLGRDACVPVPLIQDRDVVESGFLQTMQALERHPETTAVFATNDSIAYGALQACAKLGLKVPEDVSVAGFDDYSFSSRIEPALTTVKQPLFKMGRLSVECAVKLAARPFDGPPPRLVLPPELAARSSTSKAKGS